MPEFQKCEQHFVVEDVNEYSGFQTAMEKEGLYPFK
jgi:hypothetical protein